MRLGVIGCGNVGFNTLKAFKTKGFDVLGFDISATAKQRIELELGPTHVATDLDQLRTCDLIFSCVPTEQKDNSGECDLSVFEKVVKDLAVLEQLTDYRCKVFVQRSTCPPGTARRFSSLFSRTDYAVNPSFLAKGTQWEDSIAPVRIAYAGSRAALQILDYIYEPFVGSPRFTSECFETVEFLKYVENVIDAVLISLWNEFLGISDSLSIPRSEFIRLMEALAQRPRFGTTIRIPGKAFGLECLPKDLAAMVYEADRKATISYVMQGAQRTNWFMREKSGTNTIAATTLFNVIDGRVVVSDIGREFLMHKL